MRRDSAPALRSHCGPIADPLNSAFYTADSYMKASAKKCYNLADLDDFEGSVDLYPCRSVHSEISSTPVLLSDAVWSYLAQKKIWMKNIDFSWQKGIFKISKNIFGGNFDFFDFFWKNPKNIWTRLLKSLHEGRVYEHSKMIQKSPTSSASDTDISAIPWWILM